MNPKINLIEYQLKDNEEINIYSVNAFVYFLGALPLPYN